MIAKAGETRGSRTALLGITKENNISLEFVKNWYRQYDANHNYINEKVFINSLYDMKVLFSRSSEQKLNPKMIR